MTGSTSTSVRIIGLGNDFRGDDGAGCAVARGLQDLTRYGAEVREESGEGTALMEAWKGADTVILIDAVQSGAAPGAIHRLDARAGCIPSRFFHYSTHAFSVAEAIELARALDQLPPRLVVYGIEGNDFSAGQKLSAAVARAVEEVTRRVREDVMAFIDSSKLA